jgi:hypothetical protein
MELKHFLSSYFPSSSHSLSKSESVDFLSVYYAVPNTALCGVPQIPLCGRQCCGSVSRRAKMTHKNVKKLRISGGSLLRAESFSCRLDGL